MMPRFKDMFPGRIFRAQIFSKNVAPLEDKWAEGFLFRSDEGAVIMLNRKAGEGVYGFVNIDLDTLGAASGFFDGCKKDIFEGDILSISCFNRENEPQMPPPVTTTEEEPEDGFVPDNFGVSEEPEYKREYYSDTPEDAEELFSLKGVVFLSGDMFGIQFFDENTGALSALPLYPYFSCDAFPSPCCAVKVIGNMYDDEELYSQVLGLDKKDKKQQSASPKSL